MSKLPVQRTVYLLPGLAKKAANAATGPAVDIVIFETSEAIDVPAAGRDHNGRCVKVILARNNNIVPLHSLSGNHIHLVSILSLLGRAPTDSGLHVTMGLWSQLSWSCVLLSTFITPSLGGVITTRPGSARAIVVPDLPGVCRAVIS